MMVTIGMKHVKSSAVVGCIKKYYIKINIYFLNSLWTKISMFFYCKGWISF